VSAEDILAHCTSIDHVRNNVEESARCVAVSTHTHAIQPIHSTYTYEKNVLTELGIEGVLLSRRPTPDAVGNQQASVKGTLEGAEDTSTSGGGGKTNVKAHAEGAGLVLGLLDLVVLTVNLLLQYQWYELVREQVRKKGLNSTAKP
jgi:hypothetical protein